MTGINEPARPTALDSRLSREKLVRINEHVLFILSRFFTVHCDSINCLVERHSSTRFTASSSTHQFVFNIFNFTFYYHKGDAVRPASPSSVGNKSAFLSYSTLSILRMKTDKRLENYSTDRLETT